MIRYLYVLIPVLVLISLILLASISAYGIVTWIDNSLSFRSVTKKLTQFYLVLSIFPTMQYLKLSKTDLGFPAQSMFVKQLGQGILLGFITLIPAFFLLYWLGVHSLDLSQPWTLVWLVKKLVLELLLAILISVFEEPLFRGVLIAAFSKPFPITAAITVSAFYYAILHFLDNKAEIPYQELSMFSGFTLLNNAIEQLFRPEMLSAFTALFAVGLFLGMIRAQVATSLGICIGCHACWAWLIKLNKGLFNTNPDSNYLYLVSGYDGVIGPLVTVWLAVAMIGYLMFMRHLTTKKR